MSISKVKISNDEIHQLVGSPRYAICSTEASTAAKVATIDDSSGNFTLEKGARICVKFTSANSVASPTLNVAGTGAKAIYWNGGALASSQYWQAGAVLDFVYNGTQWDLVGVAKDNNTDAKVTNTLNTTTKAYITGTTSSSTNTGTQIFDTGVYLDTTAGKLNAKSVEIGTPNDISGSETTTAKFKTSNGGAIIFGKEGPNNGTMIRLDQDDGTARLRFRASRAAGAMVWEQPERGAQLYIDLGEDGVDKHRIQFPSSAGTLVLDGHSHSISNITDLQSTLDAMAETAGKAMNTANSAMDAATSAMNEAGSAYSDATSAMNQASEALSKATSAMNTADNAYGEASNAYGYARNAMDIVDSHASDTTIHVTAEEKASWDGKANSDLSNVELTLQFGVGNSYISYVCNNITYGDGKYVAVFDSSNVAVYSTDGITWTETTLPSSQRWYGVAYGDGKFVAVALNSDVAVYSTDGITWTETTLPSSQRWYGVAYGDGKFVAVALNSDVAVYSTDGITWTETTLPSSQRWYGVAYGDGKFVAVALDSDVAAYSTDGITWTKTTLPSSQSWSGLAYGDGKFVAVANNSSPSSLYSTDGITWTETTLPLRGRDLTYGNGKFVTMQNNSSKAAYSTDGITWTKVTLPVSAQWESVCAGDGKFLMVSPYADLAVYSTDGITWTETTLPRSQRFRCVAYGNGKFVASTTDGYFAYTIQLSFKESLSSIGMATKPTITTVTLSASGWDSTALTQTVTVSGILADETAQLIQVMPAPASMTAVTAAGAYCSAQGANSLTFTCSTVPTEDIVFNISFQDANYV